MREGTILPGDVAQAVKARLEEIFPGEIVYTDLTPRNFKRPCNMVEPVSISLAPLSHGLSGVDLLYKVRITTFSEVDEVHASHLPALDLRAMMVLGAFAGGYLRIKDRAPKILSLEADVSFFDCAAVTMTLGLTLDRADFTGRQLYELMQHLSLKIEPKE